MKKTVLTLLIAVSVFALAGCNENPKTEVPLEKPKAEAPRTPADIPAKDQAPLNPPHAVIPGGDPNSGMKAGEIPAGTGKKGRVIQTMNAGGYTYLEVAGKNGRKTWLALPEIKVGAGDSIEFPETPPLVNFKSRTLNRTFDRISFVPNIRIVGKR